MDQTVRIPGPMYLQETDKPLTPPHTARMTGMSCLGDKIAALFGLKADTVRSSDSPQITIVELSILKLLQFKFCTMFHVKHTKQHCDPYCIIL